MTEHVVRVLVIDDSAFARKVLRESLSTCAEIEVVGIARDGLEGLERIAALRPDVVTLDLDMPGLDGLGVLAALRSFSDRPAVVVVSLTGEDSERGVSALQAGAFDIIHKPTALAVHRLYELADDLVTAVIAAGRLANRQSDAGTPPASSSLRRAGTPVTSMVVIGASTGGPQALTTLIAALERDFPVPVAVVLHMPLGYTEAFARRVDKESAVDVVEAREGLAFRPGQVVIARAGSHLTLAQVDGEWRASLDVEPTDAEHRPSVDVLFASASRALGAGILGVLLTGMGTDGLAGARAIRAAGGRLLTQTEESCVVYGMPRCVFEAGLAVAEAPIASMASLIMGNL